MSTAGAQMRDFARLHRVRGLDFPLPFLNGSCLFEFDLLKRLLRCQRAFFASVECVLKEIWLSVTTETSKCLHKLLNNHIDVARSRLNPVICMMYTVCLLAHCEGLGGDWPPSVLNYGQFTH